jgi:putative transposase
MESYHLDQWNTTTKDDYSVFGGDVSERMHSLDKVLEKIPIEIIELDSLQEIQSKILTYFQNTLPARKPFHFAINFTKDPYYGEIVHANENDVIKSKMKDSTMKFFSYVSLYIVTKGQRLTLAVFPTKKGVPNVAYLRRSL